MTCESKLVRVFFAMFGGLAFSGSLPGGILVYESFDHAADATVTGLAGGSGWGGAWTQDGLSGKIHSAGLSYADSAGSTLDVEGRAANTANTATTRNFRAMAGGPLNDVWVSFLYRLPASNSKFEGVTFYRGTTPLFAISNAGADPGASIRFENLIGSGTVTLAKGQFAKTHFIVMKLGMGAGTSGTDRIEIFIDPLLALMPSQPDAAINGTDFSFDTLRIAGQDGASLLVDELRVGTAFAVVSPHVPADSDDSDGDGLTDEQEQILGLDPAISNAGLIRAIKQNPAFFELFDQAGIQHQAHGGSIAAKDEDAQLEIFFELQTSSDLSSWRAEQTFRRSVELPDGKNFLRFSVDADR